MPISDSSPNNLPCWFCEEQILVVRNSLCLIQCAHVVCVHVRWRIIELRNTCVDFELIYYKPDNDEHSDIRLMTLKYILSVNLSLNIFNKSLVPGMVPWKASSWLCIRTFCCVLLTPIGSLTRCWHARLKFILIEEGQTM